MRRCLQGQLEEVSTVARDDFQHIQTINKHVFHMPPDVVQGIAQKLHRKEKKPSHQISTTASCKFRKFLTLFFFSDILRHC